MKAVFAIVLGVALSFLAAPSVAQETTNPWRYAQGPFGQTEVSARSEITTPQGSGFAVLRITHTAHGHPAVIVDLLIEAPEHIPAFPFDKYEGPVARTTNEFIAFDVSPGRLGAGGRVQVMPNGYRPASPPGAFIFETIDTKVERLLVGIADGRRLKVMVNGHPKSIQVVFDTTGLKNVLDRMGMKPADRKRADPRKK